MDNQPFRDFMLKKLFLPFLFFTLFLVLVYFMHIYFLKEFFPENDLRLVKFSYPFNFIIGFLIISFIYVLRKKWKEHLAFLFMGGGIFKLMLFIVLVKITSLHIDKSNFFDFFIPYLICLSMEIILVVRILNK